MRTREMDRLLAAAARLTPLQRRELLQVLQAQPAAAQVLATVESRLNGACACPRCQGQRAVRNGHADGLQRYKCRSCGKSFNALSGTPLARLRLKSKWLDQADVLCEGLSVRKAGEQLHVAPSTSFRWRHRFLALPREFKDSGLGGIVEADETYVLRSYKGQVRRLREQGRAPRRRGGKARTSGMSREHVPIVVVRNRSAQTVDYVLDAANKFNVTELLRGVVAADAVLCTDGSLLLASVAHRLGLQHEALNVVGGQRVRGAWHIQNVNAYHSRLKDWMRRFKGVATSYLPNYTGWFRALDANAKTGLKPTHLLALAVGA